MLDQVSTRLQHGTAKADLITCAHLRPRRPASCCTLYRFGPTPAMALASKKEEDNLVSAFYNDKSTVIQEARVFNESPVSPRKCRALLTRIVYLLYVGETFGTQEATTIFFGTTKLFQNKDVSTCGKEA
jgi:hypothetical protein